tara:strand:+ start:8958 stop:10619 length:1662 start_codon:yes stop_codon:yes gene_type:complete
MAEQVDVNINVKGAEKGKKEVDKLALAIKKAKEEEVKLKKEQGELIDSFGAFGMTLGGLKKNFKAVMTASKLMFTSIKTGLIATGIGAFVVIIGSLIAYFTSTQKGAEKLEIIMTRIGATLSVLKDRVSAFGGGLIKLFTGKGKEGLQDMKNSFKGIGDEISNDVKLMGDLTKSAIALRKAEREINLETAQRRAEVEQLKLIAEDQSKATDERLVASEKAMAIENDLLAKRVANAEEGVRIQREQMALSTNLEEDKVKLTELEIGLANIKQESFTKQIELNNKINSIRKEGVTKLEQEKLAIENSRIADEKKAEALQKIADDKAIKDQEIATTELELLRISNLSKHELELDQAKTQYEKLLELANKYGQDTTKLTEKYDAQVLGINKTYAKKEEKVEELTQESKEKMIQDGLGAITGLLGENSKASKGIAVANAIRNTYLGVTNALASVPPPWNFVQAGTTLLAGMSAVKNIMKTSDSETTPPSPDLGGGGNDAPPPENTGGLMAQVQNMIPNQLTESFADGGSTQPIQAYVIENEITNAQTLQQEVELQTTL